MKHLASWTEASTPDESWIFIKELALSHALKGGQQGFVIGYFIVTDDFQSLCDYGIDYSRGTVEEIRQCRQALAYFSKYTGNRLATDPQAEAIKKFHAAEKACRETNTILRLRAQGLFSLGSEADCIIFDAQSKIARVLGECPSLEELKLRFGPGATTLTKKRDASAVEKLQAGVACSEDMVPYVAKTLEQLPHLCGLHDDGMEYSRLSDREVCTRVRVEIHDAVVEFVPKNAKTHRSICKEPPLNTMVQLAVGDLMSKRLRACGVDLKDQSVNQKLAFEGSLDGSYATLDLSSASDTISIEIVYLLLPIDWALLLATCRSSTVLLGSANRIILEKFSSMGNGYTFPLESLIFWALASSAASDGFASVYGDDIIVTTANALRVTEILRILGFTLNMEKSFWSGSFRESCGADYISGIDIRPIYQEDLISPMELFRLHNFYVRKQDEEMATIVRSHLNPSLLIYGPDGYGDGHLLGDWIRKPHKRSATHGYGGVTFDTFKLLGRRDKRQKRKGDRVLPLYSIYVNGDGDAFLPTSLGESSNEFLGLRYRLYGFARNPRLYELSDVGPKRPRHHQYDREARFASEALPERVSPVNGVSYKEPSLPGVLRENDQPTGNMCYKRVSIYTLDRGR